MGEKEDRRPGKVFAFDVGGAEGRGWGVEGGEGEVAGDATVEDYGADYGGGGVGGWLVRTPVEGSCKRECS